MPSTPKVFGTAHLYGITGTVANATVLSYKNNSKHLQEEATQNEAGQEIERRYDDVCNDATIELRIRSAYTIPAVGTVLTYETIKYEIYEVGTSQVNKGFRTIELKIKNSENITEP